jgi:hypothetical protein
MLVRRVDSPAIKNIWARVAMRRIRAQPPADRLALLERIDRTTQNQISRTRSDEWLPVAAAVTVSDALVEVLGPKRAVAFWSDVVYDSWVGGLLEPLVNNMGSDPLGLIALAPAAWSLSAQHCGEVVVVGDSSGRVRLEARNLPPEVRDSPGIQAMYAGALEAMLAFSKLAAKVEVDASGTGPIAFHLQFS